MDLNLKMLLTYASTRFLICGIFSTLLQYGKTLHITANEGEDVVLVCPQSVGLEHKNIDEITWARRVEKLQTYEAFFHAFRGFSKVEESYMNRLEIPLDEYEASYFLNLTLKDVGLNDSGIYRCLTHANWVMDAENLSLEVRPMDGNTPVKDTTTTVEDTSMYPLDSGANFCAISSMLKLNWYLRSFLVALLFDLI